MMLGEAVPQNARCEGKGLLLLYLFLGIAFLLSLPRTRYEEGPTITMASAPSAISRSIHHPPLASQFTQGFGKAKPMSSLNDNLAARMNSMALRGNSRLTQMQAATVAAPSGKFKVVYFEAYGRVETARMMLAMAGQDFEDFRYPISFGTPGDFSTIHRPEFDADQAAGKFNYGMNMIPVIESGEFRLAQSKAIERYLAKKLGMMGSSLEEEAWVDAINEHVGDISAAFAKKQSDEQWFQGALPTYMQKLETALPGTQGFAVGDKVSLADVAIYRLLRDVQPPYDSKWDSDVLAAYADCPKIKAIMANMDKNEALQKWMKERPKSTVE